VFFVCERGRKAAASQARSSGSGGEHIEHG
jgi:hypothetical protein